MYRGKEVAVERQSLLFRYKSVWNESLKIKKLAGWFIEEV